MQYRSPVLKFPCFLTLKKKIKSRGGFRKISPTTKHFFFCCKVPFKTKKRPRRFLKKKKNLISACGRAFNNSQAATEGCLQKKKLLY
jgi:hypothetical protein